MRESEKLTNIHCHNRPENKSLRHEPNQDGRFGDRIEIWTGIGRPVPLPPQLLHAMRPEPEQVRQPTSRSDQREQRQATRPVPLQDGHVGPAMGFWPITDLTRTAPASTLRPVANWVKTIGSIILQRTKTNKKGREIRVVQEKIESEFDFLFVWMVNFSSILRKVVTEIYT